MKTDRQKLLAKLHILLKEQNATEQKETICASYGIESLRDATTDQLIHMVASLDGANGAIMPIRSTTRVDSTPEMKRKRSEILSLLTWSAAAREPRKQGLGFPNDWSILNPFIVRHAGGLLVTLNIDQLAALRKKLLAIRASGWKYTKAQGDDTDRPSRATSAPRYLKELSDKAKERQERGEPVAYMRMPDERVLS